MQIRSLGALPKTCSSSAGFLLLKVFLRHGDWNDFSWHALFREKDEELIDQLERLPIQALRSNFWLSPNSRAKQIIAETDCLQQGLPYKCGLKKVNGDICERRFASIEGLTTHLKFMLGGGRGFKSFKENTAYNIQLLRICRLTSALGALRVFDRWIQLNDMQLVHGSSGNVLEAQSNLTGRFVQISFIVESVL